MKTFTLTLAAAATVVSGVASGAFADGHMAAAMVEAQDQTLAGNGTVVADKVVTPVDGWLVIHRVDDGKPGEVIGHSRLDAGDNMIVSTQLVGETTPGEELMLMIHTEEGGAEENVFEYTLGSSKDAPLLVDAMPVSTTVMVK
ncbi:hypothetical protein [Litorivita sp. NS0012-18]|uniref:DUF7282 domain-containing protein n=1 Tax=Litorivita sp. NS0012-18 TaxID=3127655 RepID=UPI00310354A5